jgi:hypothetical protein
MKKNLLFTLLTLLTIVHSYSQTLDQSWAPASAGGGTFSVSPSANVGQSFIAGITGDLSQINLRLINGTPTSSITFVAGDFQVRIFDGNGYSGTLLNTTVVNISSVSTSYQEQIITLSTLVPITQGNSYTIDFRGISGTVGIHGPNPGYAGGGLYFSNGNNGLYDSYDLWFKTFVTLPTPATHLNFDGSNDLVNLGTTLTSSFVGKTQATVEAWIRPETNTGLGVIAGNYDYPSSGLGMQMMLRRENDNYVFFLDGGSGFIAVSAANTVVLNTWQHLVGTWDGNTIRIYINGILINSTSVTGAFGVRSTSFVIGGNAQLVPEMFTGNIDEVRIWDVARTEEEINGSKNCELQGSETGLVAYYKFNQGVDSADNTSITTLTDSSSNGYNGTLSSFALTGTTSNFLAGSPVTTGSIVPSGATVTTPVVYNQGATASALTATTGTNGSGLLWYTTATGGMGATTAPTPSTATTGNTSYWVSSTNANGCESTRMQIVVTVNASAPATHLNFDGVNDSVELGNTLTAFFTGRTAVSIEAWVRPETTTALGVIVGNYSNPTSVESMQMLLRRDFDRYTFWIDNGSGYTSVFTNASSVTINTWQHVAGTWDGTTMKIYLDGVLVSSATNIGAFQASTNEFAIGYNAYTGANEKFDGDIDDLRIWDVARTIEQINGSKNCELQGTESGLQAYYKFNQGVDQANNAGVTTLTATTGPDGTLTNFALTGATSNWLAGSPVTTGSIVPSNATVTTPVVYNQGATATALTATTGTNGSGLLWYTTATGGMGATTVPTPSTATAGNTSYWVSSTNTNGCESTRTEIVVRVNANATHLNFDGNNDYVTAGNILPSSYTKEAMIFLEAYISNNIISGSDSSGQHAFWVPNARLSAGHNNTWDSVQDLVDLALNTWYHVAVSYDSPTQTLRLYKNGVLISTATNIPAPINGNQVLIGSFGNGSTFSGNIDEVRIWNKVLTATDIMNHMNCELQSTETGLVAYYKFNQGFNGENNTSITTLTDASGNANNGTLTNFARTGTTSNFLSGSPIVTGTTCTTLTLSNSNFEIANNIKMYPNPANNFVTVEVNNLTNAKLQVLDVTGKVLMNESLNNTTNSVNVQQLPTGLYFFKVTSNEGTATSKIIKN